MGKVFGILLLVLGIWLASARANPNPAPPTTSTHCATSLAGAYAGSM